MSFVPVCPLAYSISKTERPNFSKSTVHFIYGGLLLLLSNSISCLGRKLNHVANTTKRLKTIKKLSLPLLYSSLFLFPLNDLEPTTEGHGDDRPVFEQLTGRVWYFVWYVNMVVTRLVYLKLTGLAFSRFYLFSRIRQVVFTPGQSAFGIPVT